MHSSIWNSVMPFSSVGQIGGSYNQRSDSFRRDLKDNQNNTYSDGINTITRHRYGYQNNSGKQYTRDERGKKEDVDKFIQDWDNSSNSLYSEIPYHKKLAELTDYGFNTKDTIRALEEYKGNKKKALQSLITVNRSKSNQQFSNNMKELQDFGYNEEESRKALENNGNFREALKSLISQDRKKK